MSDATCQLATSATVTTVPVCAKRTVCYEFDTSATKADLAIPYLVIINGNAQGGNKLKRLSRDNRKITATVNAGSKVALYLNSDVHPDYRRTPVYEVVATDHDVVVKIKETKGKFEHIKPVIGEATLRPSSNKANTPQVAHYQASLTGDIWMSVSHRYSETEANALIPVDTPTAVRDVVCSIYRGLAGAMLKIDYNAGKDKAVQTLIVQFQRPRNAEENIVNCSLLKDVLPRTHPCAFAAIFNEACKVGITELLISSTWRPMFGSILHRAGLGLDVTTIRDANGELRINREGLTEPGHSSNKNVTDQEKISHREYQILKNADKTNQEKKPSKATIEAGSRWKTEVKRSEPKLMAKLRDELGKHQSVRQIFDPWYMEVSTNSGQQVANEQASSNETTHKDHLHLTIREPQIYE